jgi:tetratricopeptide (TPR) repeat protein
MSIFERRLILLALAAVMIIPGPAVAQIPDEFTNLKVLPEDISKRELMGIMRAFAGALGKRCNYCHVGEDANDLATHDFASDEKETKKIARIMMGMTNEINTTHLPKLENEKVTRVRCVTCHHGVDKPETIDNVMLSVTEEGGVDAAVAKYRELRDEYYGSAAYDFGAGPLNSVAETLAQKNDLAGAITIMKMNVEFNADQPFSHLLLGQLYQMSGDKDQAIASVKKCLELDPNNRWAKDILEKLQAGE